MNLQESREFWDAKHKANRHYWLTGSSPARVLYMHRLQRPRGKTVLDIGVGEGNFTRWAAKLNNRVLACDVSTVALDKVSNVAEVFTVEDLGKAPAADLGVCHLVFQHCSDEMVLHILKSVRLNSRGVFSFQFAYLRGEVMPDFKGAVGNGVLVFRELDVIQDLVKQSDNLRISRVSEPTLWPWGKGATIGWHFVRCVATGE